MTVFVFDLDNTLLDRDAMVDAYFRSLGAQGEVLRNLLCIDDRGYSDRTAMCGELARLMRHTPDADSAWDHMQRNLGKFAPRNEPLLRRLAALREHCPTVILTNAGSANQRLKLRYSGLDRSVDKIVVAGEIGFWKPDIQAFRACEVWQGQRYVMVGDHPDHDIAGAQGAGWETVWVSNARGWSGRAPPSYTIETIEQFWPLVGLL